MNLNVSKLCQDQVSVKIKLTGTRVLRVRILIAILIINAACRLFCKNVEAVFEVKE
jgi:hypothetical protein